MTERNRDAVEPGSQFPAPQGAGPASIPPAVTCLRPGSELPMSSIQMPDGPGRTALIGRTWTLVVLWDPCKNKLDAYMAPTLPGQKAQKAPPLPDFLLNFGLAPSVPAADIIPTSDSAPAPALDLSSGPTVSSVPPDSAPASDSGPATPAAPVSGTSSGTGVSSSASPASRKRGRHAGSYAGSLVRRMVEEEIRFLSNMSVNVQLHIYRADRIKRAWSLGCAYCAADSLDSVVHPDGVVGLIPGVSFFYTFLIRSTRTGKYTRSYNTMLQHAGRGECPRLDASVILTTWASAAESVAFLRGAGAATVDLDPAVDPAADPAVEAASRIELQ